MRILFRLLAALFACSTIGAAIGAVASQTIPVAQKRRMFAPRELSITAGDTLVFVNDDGELLHHAYVRSDTFSFDIGEQAPGTQVPVRFTRPGSFQVRCDIHPRMVLDVTVK